MFSKLFRALFAPAPLDPWLDAIAALDELKAMVAEEARSPPPPSPPIGVVAGAVSEQPTDKSR